MTSANDKHSQGGKQPWPSDGRRARSQTQPSPRPPTHSPTPQTTNQHTENEKYKGRADTPLELSAFRTPRELRPLIQSSSSDKGQHPMMWLENRKDVMVSGDRILKN